jgi:hypothetical protein
MGNASSKRVSFLHTPLEHPGAQIRLLELQPCTPSGASDFDQPIYCSIETVPLDQPEPPPYKALSYCWGDENQDRRDISIGGKALSVTVSLDLALRHLRHGREKPLVLWIDQICIMQGDTNIPEKNAQVAMMARIYRSAEQVLVWLGAACDGSDGVMDFYRQVGAAIKAANLQHYCTRDNSDILYAAVHAKDPYDELWQQADRVQTLARKLVLPQLAAVVAWDRREWFRRVWVVQEFCVGPDPVFVCGCEHIPADYVKTTRMFLGYGITHEFLNDVQAQGEGRMELVNRLSNSYPAHGFFSMRSRKQGGALFELLREVHVDREAHAGRSVDRVFGLISLASDAGDLGLRVDYNKPAARVLADVAKALIRGGNLAVLAYVQYPRDEKLVLPSWAPDWRPNLCSSFYPYQGAELEGQPYFQPSRGRQPGIMAGMGDAVLGLGGFAVDVVEDMGDIFPDDDTVSYHRRYQGYLAQIQFLCRLSAFRNCPIYPSWQRREEAEWRVPIADIWEANEAGPGSRQRATHRAMRALAELRDELAWMESPRQGAPPATMNTRLNEASMYRLGMSKMKGMRPFITRYGYVGVGPGAMCPGDVVVVFFGAQVCSVLRPKGSWTILWKKYQYIGEAYCDGVMDGELAGQRWEEAFILV